MKIFCCTIFVIFFFPTVSLAQDSKLVEELKTLTSRHFEALEAERFDQVEATFHPHTPVLSQSLQIARQLAEVYDLEFEIGDHWIYIGQDSEYAYARIEQFTRKLDGPAFTDGAVDQIWVFRRFEDEWRIWTTGILSIDPFLPSLSITPKRRSTYPSINIIFDLTDTTIVDCDSRAEFIALKSDLKAICGVTEAEWESFTGFELTLWFKGQLAPEKWKVTDTQKHVTYFDKDEGLNLILTYIEGGFVTAVPLPQ